MYIVRPRSEMEAIVRSWSLVAAIVIVGGFGEVNAQQVADTVFSPQVTEAAFPAGSGPLVLVDEAHFNFHTIAGRYSPFARLLREDGFAVAPNRDPLTAASLQRTRVLVIANALPDTLDWVLPTPPAFTAVEVAAVEQWVNDGGSLLLIADHMPFAGAAANLAAAFGLVFQNGYAVRPSDYTGQYVFRRGHKSLGDDIITMGRRREERIDSVVSFTGQAFRALRPVRALMTIDSSLTLFFPSRDREIDAQTPQVAAVGLLQGAVLQHGRGRVAVFGEAAMFSAQLAGAEQVPMGMNHPEAHQNGQFALNVVRWLVGVLEPDSIPAGR
jgi:hypothetical protein